MKNCIDYVLDFYPLWLISYLWRHKVPRRKNQIRQIFDDPSKTGVYVSTAHDRIIIPGEYTLAEVIEKRRIEAAIVIQKHFRRYMAEQTVAQLKSDLAKFEEWVAEARRTKTKQKEDRKAENLRRRLNPRTEKDFELVWHALEQWREEQVIFRTCSIIRSKGIEFSSIF